MVVGKGSDLKGMADLGMFELEDIVWDEFSESGDHIVPRPDGDLVNALFQGDLRTKSQCEIVSSGGRSRDTRKSIIESVLSKMKEPITHSPLKEGMSQMLEKSSWSHTQDTGDTDCINTVTGLAENSKMCDNALKNGHADSVCNKFPTDDHNLCQFQVDSEMEFFRSEQEDKECSDLFGYGWPDIGNFEDVDQMFRTCDSTFGQGNDGGADEPSWLSSSSTAVDSREDTYKLGFRMKHETNSKFIPDDESLLVGDYDNKNIAYTLNSWISDADEASNTGFTNWLIGDCDNKGESASMEQALDEESKLLPSTQVKTENTVAGKQGMDVGNMQTKQPKSQIKSEGNKRNRSSEHPSGSSAHGPKKRQLTNLKLSSTVPLHSLPSPQKQVWVPTSVNYPHRPTPHEKLAHYPYADPPATTTSKSENKNNLRPYSISTHASNNTQPQRSDLSNPPAPRVVGNVLKLQGRHQVLAQLSGGSHEQLVSRIRFPDKNLAQKQLNCIRDEVRCNSEVEEQGIELLDSFTIQESSCMSSVLSNGVSLEESSLRQLQDVMDQLDMRTKLRIRDSLYRLARSAEQRHNCGNTNSCSRDGRGRTRVQITEESYECPGYMDAETDTNPIDRSIAHLLFDRPAVPSPGSTNGAFSLESHIMIPDSVSNHPVMTNQIDCSTDNKVADYDL